MSLAQKRRKTKQDGEESVPDNMTTSHFSYSQF
jgi:hypothetical protein